MIMIFWRGELRVNRNNNNKIDKMKLNNFYKLRKDFTIIGLTGRIGTGSSKISNLLSDDNFISNINYNSSKPIKSAEETKFDICFNYLSHKGNWRSYKVISYKEILLLHVFYEAVKSKKFKECFTSILCLNGDNDYYKNRFGKKEDDEFIINRIYPILDKYESKLIEVFPENENDINQWLKDDKNSLFIKFYFEEFKNISNELYIELNKYSATKRTRFNHDVANNLRKYGSCLNVNGCETCEETYDYIYTVAETINRLIKLWRKSNNDITHVVIDSLKNSLELMYFKEKYSGFYMVAVNKDETERLNYLKTKKEIINHCDNLIHLDKIEYKGDEVNKGILSSPDIENCIQKSDFHIFHSDNNLLNSENRENNLEHQLIKLLALINQPGIITPTPEERIMQIAYSAKYNSGCISRQVGAVITDKHFAVKSIGWNDVAQNQMPCKLRSIKDLVSEDNRNHHLFSDYEKNGFAYEDNNSEKVSFIKAVDKSVKEADFDKLEGKHCSFCFKSFQNEFENEKNQVHTRSLHAEENAMLQITKYGGMAVKDGYLFTTASPCELCSKKAFQLGITNIYYIDPYPGIAMQHTLKNGVDEKLNPILKMFKGAVGRAYFKLYEPFISYKDEISILTGLKPKKEINIEKIINNLTSDEIIKNKIIALLNNEND